METFRVCNYNVLRLLVLETSLKIKGKNAYLYRAVDSEGNTIDFFVSEHRDKDAAEKFFRKALKATYNQQPRVITTDKYAATEVAAVCVEQIEDANWKDLGMPETLWTCKVKEFGPLIISIDTHGRNLFEENKVDFNRKKEEAIAEICKHVSFIK